LLKVALNTNKQTNNTETQSYLPLINLFNVDEK
jgi:hypothetical protein